MRFLVSTALFTTLSAGSLAIGALPAAAHPRVNVANPQPGDTLIPGSMVIQGVAFDHDATEGVGVDKVSIYVCPRGEGGQYLGDASLGLAANIPLPSTQFALSGWAFKTPALHGGGDLRSLCVYARSSVTGTETLVRIPVKIGEAHPKQSNEGAREPAEPGEVVTNPDGGSGSPAAGPVGGGGIVQPGGEDAGPDE